MSALKYPPRFVGNLGCLCDDQDCRSPDAKSTLSLGVIMLAAYLPVLMFLGVGLALALVLLALGLLMGPRRPDAAKDSAFECGFEAFDDARMKFDVRYYLVAILFIIFDLEIAFLFPWAVVLSEIGMAGLIGMALFIGILLVGFAYEWKKGALEWE